jgi:TolB protein
MISIEITRGNVDPLPVALPPLPGNSPVDSQRGRQISEVIAADLERSGLFRSIPERAFLQEIQSSFTVPIFGDWRRIEASGLMTGGVTERSATEVDVEFRLWDVFAEQQIAGKAFTTHPNNWRRVAHLIADEIYTRLTGEDGYFDTRIVYVAETGPQDLRVKRLAIMDQDGANHRFLTDGSYLVLTPRFSPNAQEVIYMSYAERTPKVHLRNIDTGKDQVIGNFSGMSFAPRFAPDGESIVMSVEVGGDSEIVNYNLQTRRTIQLTKNPAIDTSPSYSPDGSQIVFNSDRGGAQQLYVMDAAGNNVRRISFGQGRYGTPVWSPRGDLIAFTKMYAGRFYIGVMRADGAGERLLTESFLDEGPTWSPNGRVIIFSRQTPSTSFGAGKTQLHSIDLTGYNERRVSTPVEASDPAWSPRL